MRQTYMAHNDHARSYFEKWPGRFIELPLEMTSTSKWHRLCPFLGVPVPAKEYPHMNRGRQ